MVVYIDIITLVYITWLPKISMAICNRPGGARARYHYVNPVILTPKTGFVPGSASRAWVAWLAGAGCGAALGGPAA